MLWLTGAAIEWFIAGSHASSGLRAAISSSSGDGVPSVLRAASIALTLGTLAFVLLFVQVLRFVVPARPPQPEAQKPKIERKAA
jgi:TctA family transporter